MPPAMVAVLQVIGGPAVGTTIWLDGDLTVGREGRHGGVSLADDTEMSRQHARFRPLPSGAVLVEDLGSSNGTLVNGERIAIPRLLELGDAIELGGTTMRLDRIVDDRPREAHPPDAETVIPVPPPPTISSESGAPKSSSPPDGADRLPSVALPTLPPPPPAAAKATPAVGRERSPARRRGRWVVVVLAVVVVATAVGFGAGTLAGRPAANAGKNGDQAAGTGTVYLESGASQPGANAVIAYRYGAGGDLRPLAIQEYVTGGSAGFDLNNTGALDSDGQIVVSADDKLLFAVNQGSDTVAAFHIAAGGALAAVSGSPFPSGGVAPGGLALAGNRLVVVNKAQDGVRDLHSVSPNVTSFLIMRDGSLRPTGSVITALPGSSPTEALVTPDTKVVVVPEEHGPMLSLTLSPNGTLRPAPGSPFALPASIFPLGLPETQRWALGVGALPQGGVLYGQAVDTAQLVVYRYDDSGRLSFQRAVPDPGAFLPCWTLLNTAGTRLYTDNAGNNTMSVYDLTDPLNPRQLQVVTLKNAGNPWDLRLDPSGHFIFVLDPRDRQDLVTPGGGNELHTLLVNSDGTLTEPSYSPVPIPVPLNTNPIGLGVVGH